MSIPVAFPSDEDGLMELEIKRHLENIQKTGETKWSIFINDQNKKKEVKKENDLKVRMVVN